MLEDSVRQANDSVTDQVENVVENDEPANEGYLNERVRLLR